MAPSSTRNATWRGAPADMLPDSQEHSLIAAMDGDDDTAAWIAWPRACSAMRFTFGRPLLAGGAQPDGGEPLGVDGVEPGHPCGRGHDAQISSAARSVGV